MTTLEATLRCESITILDWDVVPDVKIMNDISSGLITTSSYLREPPSMSSLPSTVRSYISVLSETLNSGNAALIRVLPLEIALATDSDSFSS